MHTYDTIPISTHYEDVGPDGQCPRMQHAMYFALGALTKLNANYTARFPEKVYWVHNHKGIIYIGIRPGDTCFLSPALVSAIKDGLNGIGEYPDEKAGTLIICNILSPEWNNVMQATRWKTK